MKHYSGLLSIFFFGGVLTCAVLLVGKTSTCAVYTWSNVYQTMGLLLVPFILGYLSND